MPIACFGSLESFTPATGPQLKFILKFLEEYCSYKYDDYIIAEEKRQEIQKKIEDGKLSNLNAAEIIDDYINNIQPEINDEDESAWHPGHPDNTFFGGNEWEDDTPW